MVLIGALAYVLIATAVYASAVKKAPVMDEVQTFVTEVIDITPHLTSEEAPERQQKAA